jgi:eukaryotic translation initiation factor 2C
MMDFRNASFGARVNVFVKGVRVKTTHLGYKKTVKALSNVNAKQHKFEVAEFGGASMSVETYFKRSSISCVFYDCSHLV